MGVKGLWRLLLPIGRRISIETLEGKILAIDASIWLTQFIKAMRDDSGNLRQAAHLIGFFRRICRLKYHKIKPVFVFDGATPEIKRREVLQRKRRREQFAKVSDETVQRMAKKLLAENLRKQATLKATPEGAFVAGFNPTNDEDRKLPASPRVEDVAVDGDAKPEAKVSDWDAPLAVAAAAEAEEREDEEEAQTQYEDFIAKEEFSIEQISSLPAVKRKDAIEHSKRQQRLQSRKEFMPAAANPDKFSSVQLKNFLKYCKLNKDIVKMAKVAADKDNAGLSGDAMASDRATRIELIREDEPNDNSGPIRSLLAERINAKRKRTKENDDDVSSDESWSNGNATGRRVLDDDDNAAAPIAASTKRSRRMIVLEEDSSNDEEADSGGGFVASSNQRSKRSDALELLDDSSTGSGSAGGFVVASNATNDPSPGQADTIDLLHDSDSEDGGGFITAQPADDHVGASVRLGSDQGTGAKRNGDAESASRNIGEISATTDATLAQELADNALARALQMEEDQYSSRQNHDDTARTVDQATRSSSAQPFESNTQPKIIVPAKPTAAEDDAVSKSKADAPMLHDSSEEDSVEWEDGDDQELPIPVANAVVSIPTDKSRSPAKHRGNIAQSFDAFNGQVNDSQSFSDAESTGEPGANTAQPQPDGDNDGVSEALMNAQATASNLANWAGRAFRRAIKEVGNTDKAIRELPREVTEPPALNQVSLEPPSAVVPTASTPDAAPAVRDTADQTNEGLHSPARKDSLVGSHGQQSSASRATGREEDRGGFEFPFDPDLLDGYSGINEPTEAHRRERDMETISDEMLLEAKQLLQLFGVPYVEAPAEAEAQCAALERLGLVDGIVTEDSDVFVFGGKTVYKNIFEEQKYAEVYVAGDAEREMGLGPNSMVALAMLLGGDYTEGVKGVGIVNAMELLGAFDVSRDLKGGLRGFKEWLEGFDPTEALRVKSKAGPVRSEAELAFHANHKTARTRWIAPPNFPSDVVLKAYQDPVVDNSTERFSWGAPDAGNLVRFCHQHMGWPPEDTKRLLDPVLQAKGGMRQTRIDSYMKYEDALTFADVKSKRLREVLGLNKKDSSKQSKSS